MKKVLTAILMVGIWTTGFSQSKVSEKDIIGEWQLVIDIDRDEIEDEIEEEGNWLAERFAKAVSNFALNIVEDIDIEMDFRADGELRISIDIFGAHETEYAEWEINSRGELIINDDDSRDRRGRRSRHFDIGDDHDVWMMEGKKLVSYDKGYRGKLKRESDVYMVKKR